MTKRKRNAQEAILSAKGIAQNLPPALVFAYKAAVMQVCGTVVSVSNKQFKQVLERQRVLDENNVAYDSYAYTVVQSYWTWCKTKGMRSVPINMFLGDAAWDRFQRMEKSTVRLETASEENWNLAVHAELTAARAYIDARLSYKFATTLEFCRRYCASDPSPDVVTEVEKLLGMVHKCSGNYDQIYKTIKARRSKMMAEMPYVKLESDETDAAIETEVTDE